MSSNYRRQNITPLSKCKNKIPIDNFDLSCYYIQQIRGGRASALSEIIPVEPDPGNAGVGRIEMLPNPFSLMAKGFFHLECLFGQGKEQVATVPYRTHE